MKQGHRAEAGSHMLRVCYVSPTYFSPDSVIGGGERFAEELARAMSKYAAVKFISFGARPFREVRSPSFERVILRSWFRALFAPFSPRLFRELRDAEVIHCHQYFVLPTFLACLYGRLKGKRVFVSDLGGGGWTPGFHIDQSRWITAHLPISQYAAGMLPGRNTRHHVIYGGVDLGRYPMRSELSHDGSAVFLGRVLAHKGIHFLIEGLPEGIPLRVIGPMDDAGYLERLRGLAAGKPVTFLSGLSDEEVVSHLRTAMVLVHPTPVDESGSARGSELFGLALVEAMACGCPVVASNVTSLPEIVQPGVSGFLLPPNRPEAIREAVLRLREDPGLWRRLSAGARQTVEERFTWDRVAVRCLEAYQDLLRRYGGACDPGSRTLSDSCVS